MLRAAPLLLLSACSSSPPPSCPSSIPSQVLPDTTTPVYWSDDTGCIEISYGPALQDRAEELVDAVKAWTTLDCGRLCFADPVERPLPENGVPALFTIHLDPLAAGASQPSRTVLTFRFQTGQIDRALVEVDATLEPPDFRRATLRALGRALGFDTAPAGVPSILNLETYRDLTELTEEDRTAYCAKYGAC